MATKKTPGRTASKQEILSAAPATPGEMMTARRAGELLDQAKKELGALLAELAQEESTIGKQVSQERAKLLAVLTKLEQIIRPIPPVHKYG
ncbi:MAG: hypothetical protein JOZ67_07885 [Gammaproteobacteria bacterium]|nr:hypothetical protein [Gammaproteobacteria bacterium]MBV9695649.1 hypothetical protein [Gammaproteobacteria bacterium]